MSVFMECLIGVKGDGSVDAWGYRCETVRPNIPEERFSEVSMGYDHVCGVTIEGETLCWGVPERDETKHWTQDDPPPGNFHGLAAGQWQTCALDEESRVVCWGYNGSPDWLWPLDTVASQVGAGLMVQCALREDRSIQCWGSQHWVVEPEGNDYVEIAVGWYHVCGRTTKGTVRCAGSYDPEYPVPSPPENLRFKKISAGLDTICGILDSGAIECWGSEFKRSAVVYDRPRFPDNFTSIDLGSNCACALDAGGYATCWGDNRDACQPPTP